MDKYTVAIIGCGSIGVLKDDKYDKPGGDAILTHAHAIHAHPEADLLAVIDNDGKKLDEASRKWDCLAANPIEALWECVRPPDIVVVATPTDTHEKVLLDLLKLDPLPKLVIAEKPFCSSLKQASWVANHYASAGVPILVDYIRRFDHATFTTLIDLRDGAYGRIYHARCLYGRGLKHDGCHGLDIFNYVFGDPMGVMFDHASEIADRDPADPTLTVRLEYHSCREVYMVGADSRSYGMFEVEFVTDSGIVSFVEWGKTIVKRSPREEITFGQYKSLHWPPAVTMGTGLDTALLGVVDNAVRHLRDGEPLKCTAEDALKVHRILDHIGGRK